MKRRFRCNHISLVALETKRASSAQNISGEFQSRVGERTSDKGDMPVALARRDDYLGHPERERGSNEAVLGKITEQIPPVYN